MYWNLVILDITDDLAFTLIMSHYDKFFNLPIFFDT